MSTSQVDPPRSLRITNRGRDQLITIKRRTGLQNWNVICRWAFALSLRENTAPPKVDQSGDSSVEMTWDVFGGLSRDQWYAVGLQRFHEEPGSHESFAQFFRAHVHRGIQMMSAQGQAMSINDVISTVM